MKRPLEHLRPSMTLVMVSGMIGFMAWASWFEIDQTELAQSLDGCFADLRQLRIVQLLNRTFEIDGLIERLLQRML